ncbi:MAG: hypothetical protein AAF698_11260, partial [Pseudomonadota bacterium]
MQDQSHDPSAFLDYVAPVWFEELTSGLAIRSMFVLSGNTRDLYPVKGEAVIDFRPFESTVWGLLEAKGYATLLIHDPVDGLRLHDGCDPRMAEILQGCGITLGTIADTPEKLTALVQQVTAEGRLPVALILDYASILLRGEKTAVERLFVAMD